jgi:hypothetical protein
MCDELENPGVNHLTTAEFINNYRLTSEKTHAIKIPVTPIKALRHFFEQDKDTKPLSTQFGLSQLVGRSESLIRAVESGRVSLSPKLARLLSMKTGASEAWLMKPDVDGKVIPSADGGTLNHINVLARVQHEISASLSKVARTLETKNSTHARMADAIAKLVADEILEYLEGEDAPSPSGEEDPITFILAWLRSRADARKHR